MTEGERGTFGLTKYYFFEKYYYAGSFHHFVVPLPPGGRLVCARSVEEFIVCVYRLSRTIYADDNFLSRANGLTKPSPVGEGGGVADG